MFFRGFGPSEKYHPGRFRQVGDSVAVPYRFAFPQAVHRTAVRTARLAGFGHIQINLGVAVPDFHVGLGAGAEHPAVGVEVLGEQFHCCVFHVDHLVSGVGLARPFKPC